MYSTVSARQIQRQYRKIVDQANELKEPIVIMSNNKPIGAIIGLDILEKLQVESVLKEALDEYHAGKSKSISTPQELNAEIEEINRLAG